MRLQPVQIDDPSTPLLRVIANNPRMVPLYRTMTQILVRESALPPRVRWLLTMRTAFHAKCSYEFGRHGKDPALASDMALVPLPLSSPQLPTMERQLFALADQIHQTQNIDDALWAELSATYTPEQIVEMISVVGLYIMAASVANSCGVTDKSV